MLPHLFVLIALLACLSTLTSSLLSPSDKIVDLRNKVAGANSPIFEFREIIDSILVYKTTQSGATDFIDDFDLDTLFADYTEKLCKLYTVRFLKHTDALAIEQRTHTNLNLCKLDSLKECRIAMEKARPLSRVEVWDVEGALRDLDLDLDSLMETLIGDVNTISRPNDVFTKTGNDSKLNKGLFNFLGAKMKKRLKWVAMQSVVLLVNYFQNELSRRYSIHLVDKRHAEVPTFPLL